MSSCLLNLQDEELNELEKLKLELEVAQQRVVKAEQATALAMQRVKYEKKINLLFLKIKNCR